MANKKGLPIAGLQGVEDYQKFLEVPRWDTAETDETDETDETSFGGFVAMQLGSSGKNSCAELELTWQYPMETSDSC